MSGILESTAFALQITYHTTLHAIPGQLVLGSDMILNTPLIAEWEDIRQHKQKLLDKITKLKTKIANGTHIEYTIKYYCVTKHRISMRIRT